MDVLILSRNTRTYLLGYELNLKNKVSVGFGLITEKYLKK